MGRRSATRAPEIFTIDGFVIEAYQSMADLPVMTYSRPRRPRHATRAAAAAAARSPSPAPRPISMPPPPPPPEPAACAVCLMKNNPNKILSCISCPRTFHAYCLNPPQMSLPPPTVWTCPLCIRKEPLRPLKHKKAFELRTALDLYPDLCTDRYVHSVASMATVAAKSLICTEPEQYTSVVEIDAEQKGPHRKRIASRTKLSVPDKSAPPRKRHLGTPASANSAGASSSSKASDPGNHSGKGMRTGSTDQNPGRTSISVETESENDDDDDENSNDEDDNIPLNRMVTREYSCRPKATKVPCVADLRHPEKTINTAQKPPKPRQMILDRAGAASSFQGGPKSIGIKPRRRMGKTAPGSVAPRDNLLNRKPKNPPPALHSMGKLQRRSLNNQGLVAKLAKNLDREVVKQEANDVARTPQAAAQKGIVSPKTRGKPVGKSEGPAKLQLKKRGRKLPQKSIDIGSGNGGASTSSTLIEVSQAAGANNCKEDNGLAQASKCSKTPETDVVIREQTFPSPSRTVENSAACKDEMIISVNNNSCVPKEVKQQKETSGLSIKEVPAGCLNQIADGDVSRPPVRSPRIIEGRYPCDPRSGFDANRGLKRRLSGTPKEASSSPSNLSMAACEVASGKRRKSLNLAAGEQDVAVSSTLKPTATFIPPFSPSLAPHNVISQGARRVEHVRNAPRPLKSTIPVNTASADKHISGESFGRAVPAYSSSVQAASSFLSHAPIDEGRPRSLDMVAPPGGILPAHNKNYAGHSKSIGAKNNLPLKCADSIVDSQGKIRHSVPVQAPPALDEKGKALFTLARASVRSVHNGAHEKESQQNLRQARGQPAQRPDSSQYAQGSYTSDPRVERKHSTRVEPSTSDIKGASAYVSNPVPPQQFYPPSQVQQSLRVPPDPSRSRPVFPTGEARTPLKQTPNVATHPEVYNDHCSNNIMTRSPHPLRDEPQKQVISSQRMGLQPFSIGNQPVQRNQSPGSQSIDHNSGSFSLNPRSRLHSTHLSVSQAESNDPRSHTQDVNIQSASWNTNQPASLRSFDLGSRPQGVDPIVLSNNRRYQAYDSDRKARLNASTFETSCREPGCKCYLEQSHQDATNRGLVRDAGIRRVEADNFENSIANHGNPGSLRPALVRQENADTGRGGFISSPNNHPVHSGGVQGYDPLRKELNRPLRSPLMRSAQEEKYCSQNMSQSITPTSTAMVTDANISFGNSGRASFQSSTPAGNRLSSVDRQNLRQSHESQRNTNRSGSALASNVNSRASSSSFGAAMGKERLYRDPQEHGEIGRSSSVKYYDNRNALDAYPKNLPSNQSVHEPRRSQGFNISKSRASLSFVTPNAGARQSSSQADLLPQNQYSRDQSLKQYPTSSIASFGRNSAEGSTYLSKGSVAARNAGTQSQSEGAVHPSRMQQAQGNLVASHPAGGVTKVGAGQSHISSVAVQNSPFSSFQARGKPIPSGNASVYRPHIQQPPQEVYAQGNRGSLSNEASSMPLGSQLNGTNSIESRVGLRDKSYVCPPSGATKADFPSQNASRTDVNHTSRTSINSFRKPAQLSLPSGQSMYGAQSSYQYQNSSSSPHIRSRTGASLNSNLPSAGDVASTQAQNHKVSTVRGNRLVDGAQDLQRSQPVVDLEKTNGPLWQPQRLLRIDAVLPPAHRRRQFDEGRALASVSVGPSRATAQYPRRGETNFSSNERRLEVEKVGPPSSGSVKYSIPPSNSNAVMGQMTSHLTSARNGPPRASVERSVGALQYNHGQFEVYRGQPGPHGTIDHAHPQSQGIGTSSQNVKRMVSKAENFSPSATVPRTFPPLQTTPFMPAPSGLSSRYANESSPNTKRSTEQRQILKHEGYPVNRSFASGKNSHNLSEGLIYHQTARGVSTLENPVAQGGIRSHNSRTVSGTRHISPQTHGSSAPFTNRSQGYYQETRPRVFPTPSLSPGRPTGRQQSESDPCGEAWQERSRRSQQNTGRGNLPSVASLLQ